MGYKLLLKINISIGKNWVIKKTHAEHKYYVFDIGKKYTLAPPPLHLTREE